MREVIITIFKLSIALLATLLVPLEALVYSIRYLINGKRFPSVPLNIAIMMDDVKGYFKGTF